MLNNSRYLLHLTVLMLGILLVVLVPFIRRSITGRFVQINSPHEWALMTSLLAIICSSIVTAFLYGSREFGASKQDQSKKFEDYPQQPDIAIAFSGGGVRSARLQLHTTYMYSFCFGALQILIKSGILKDSKYLSSVSGGGYTATSFVAWITKLKESQPALSSSELMEKAIEKMSQKMPRNCNFLLKTGYLEFVLAGMGSVICNFSPIMFFLVVLSKIISFLSGIPLLVATAEYRSSLKYGSSMFQLLGGWIEVFGISTIILFFGIVSVIAIVGLVRIYNRISNNQNQRVTAIGLLTQQLSRYNKQVDAVVMTLKWVLSFIFLYYCIMLFSFFILTDVSVHFGAIALSGFWSIVSAMVGTAALGPVAKRLSVAISLVGVLLIPIAIAANAVAWDLEYTCFQIFQHGLVDPPPSSSILHLGVTCASAFNISVNATTFKWEKPMTFEDISLVSQVYRNVSPLYLIFAGVILLALVNLSYDYTNKVFHIIYAEKLKRAFYPEEFDPHIDKVHQEKGIPKFIVNVAINNATHQSFADPTVFSDHTTNMFYSKDTSGGQFLGECNSALLDMKLSEVMAISGAAVSVDMGSYDSPTLLKLVMWILGVSLGVWVYIPQAFKPHNVYTTKPTCSVGSWNFAIVWAVLMSSVIGFTISEAIHFSPGSIIFLVLLFFTPPAFVILGEFIGVVKETYWPSPVRGLAQISGVPSALMTTVFASDGGHYENLGIFELIRRNCKNVFSFDAGEDPEWRLQDLSALISVTSKEKALSENRDWYCTFSIVNPANTNTSNPATSGIATLFSHKLIRQHLQQTKDRLIQIEYKKHKVSEKERKEYEASLRSREVGLKEEEDEEVEMNNNNVTHVPFVGTIWFAKASLVGDEDPELQLFALSHPDFPHHSTANQFFDPATFHAYEKLGKHTCTKLLEMYRTSSHSD